MRTKNDELQERILVTAVKYFNEKGFAGTLLDDIAKELKISRQPLYYYFGNKVELYKAAADWQIGAKKEDYTRILTPGRPVLEIIRQDYMYCLESAPLFFARPLAKGEPDLHAEFYDFSNWLTAKKHDLLASAQKAGEIRKDADISEMVTMIYVYFDGFQAVKRYSDYVNGFNKELVDHSVDALEDLFRSKYLTPAANHKQQ